MHELIYIYINRTYIEKKQIERKLVISATIFVAISLAVLWFSPVVYSPSNTQSSSPSYAQLLPEISKTVSQNGLHAIANETFTMSGQDHTISFIESYLASSTDNSTGFLITVLLDNLVSGSVMEITQNYGNTSTFSIIPRYLSNVNTTNELSVTNDVTIANNASSVSPDAQTFPSGTYTSGWLGWAYSWNNYNTELLVAWLAVGGLTTGVIKEALALLDIAAKAIPVIASAIWHTLACI